MRFALTALGLVAAISGACTRSPAGENPDAPTPASSRRERLLIEWIGAGARDSYHCSLLAGARAAAQAVGVDLFVRDMTGTDSLQQARLLSAAIGRRANAVVLDPVDYSALWMNLRASHDRGVPVVLVNVRQDHNPGLVWSFVGPDPAQPAFEIGVLAVNEAIAAAFSQPGLMLPALSEIAPAEVSECTA